MKRIGTLMLAAALILSLAACSNSSSSMGSSLSSAGNALDENASSETFGEMIDEVLPNRPLPRARFPATQNSARPSVRWLLSRMAPSPMSNLTLSKPVSPLIPAEL